MSFNPNTISTVNHDARLERHHKLFGKARSKLARWRQLRVRRQVHATNARHRFTDPLGGFSPSQRLFQRVAATGFVFLLINSVSFASAYDTGGVYVSGYDDLSIDTNLNLVSDDEGYLTKAMPLEGEARYLNRGKEVVTHEVQSGDTLSVIAYRYDLSMETILWANPNLGSGNFLKIGQEIQVPPADGLKVKVESGDTWESLIKEYKSEVSQDEIIAWNEADTVTEGTEVFILGGRNPEPVYVASADNRDYNTSRGDSRGEIPTDVVVVPVGDGTWVRPTSGSLTQGFHWGHYAYDIADRSKPPVVAVADGTVTKVETGWGGGYGNHIIIDHGNGYTTLYAHNEELYVSEGDYVTQGQVISKMGNTGNVRGATGIHLHFELTYNGTKIDPAPVFGW